MNGTVPRIRCGVGQLTVAVALAYISMPLAGGQVLADEVRLEGSVSLQSANGSALTAEDLNRFVLNSLTGSQPADREGAVGRLSNDGRVSGKVSVEGVGLSAGGNVSIDRQHSISGFGSDHERSVSGLGSALGSDRERSGSTSGMDHQRSVSTSSSRSEFGRSESRASVEARSYGGRTETVSEVETHTSSENGRNEARSSSSISSININ